MAVAHPQLSERPTEGVSYEEVNADLLFDEAIYDENCETIRWMKSDVTDRVFAGSNEWRRNDWLGMHDGQLCE